MKVRSCLLGLASFFAMEAHDIALTTAIRAQPAPVSPAARTVTGDPHPVPLRASLRSGNRRSQANAAFAIGQSGDAGGAAVPELKQVLARDKGWDLLWASRPGPYPRGDTSPGREAAKALAKLGEPGRQALVDTLRAPNPDARLNAALTLAEEFKDPRAIPVLIKYSDTDSFGFLMGQEAMTAAGGIGEAAVPALRDAVRTGQWNTRRVAIIYLGRLVPAESIDLFIATFSDRRGDIRLAILDAIDVGKYPRAIPIFEAALKDGDDRVRCHAAEALTKLDDPGVRVAVQAAFAQEKVASNRMHCFQQTGIAP